ncbi:DNA-3-methyladenine glycosylase family protein [Neobacillus terrae]|uniref:DNA-3-methyladenine glycosylase family protein n=1 Tax=Neobacillus terrae TaxID=3034837 RepID=UPI00140A1FDF|nr:DNA-3-methyladenine glycosylase 2 family protein [Neobacillus terrae]NHM30820.1 DNA-3-methyladenine glycosylase 2 family protein [Neobacillus terrae]
MSSSNLSSMIKINTPRDFNFEECLVFLDRSNQELLHRIKDGYLYKLIKVDQELILLKISYKIDALNVEFPLGDPSKNARKLAAEFIVDWFDLEQDLADFYEMALYDNILNQIASKYRGLRIIGIPDLFEALTWAILGQQINLKFAYTLKKRFVERFGEGLMFEGETYWLYPSFDRIAEIDIEHLRELQFTVRKAEYVIGVAKAMSKGELKKENLLKKQDYLPIHNYLTNMRGIGAWTADYVMMKCLHQRSAFPITDVGLHNAIKFQLGLEGKPTINEIKEMALNWTGWEAYAVFYLWRSLYD